MERCRGGRLGAPRGTIANTHKTHRKININVGGILHSPFVSTLKNVPDSPLAWIIRDEYQDCLDYDADEDCYFFDRHPGVFAQVLHYFQTGKLHCPRDICGPMFQAELHFWGIDETQMEACCWPDYTEHREIQENLRSLFNLTDRIHTKSNETYIKDRLPRRIQMAIWNFLEDPYSSGPAKAFAWVSLGIIILSIITFSLMTVGSFTEKSVCTTTQMLSTASLRYHQYGLFTNSTAQTCKKERTELLNFIRHLELGFAIWFSIEIVLRLLVCPNKRQFLLSCSNGVDFIAVIPVFLLIQTDNPSEVIMIFNMLRYVRILRFLKLLYDLHILGKTLQASMNQLVIMVLILFLPALIFSCIVYYTELYFGDEQSKKDFSDIPAAIWWSIITMTTVGYGDVTPFSALGRIMGAFATVVGILIVSMTASVIGSSFQQYYQVARTQLKIPAKNRQGPNLDNEGTLISQLQKLEKKSTSIQSTESKDSGYGRSPIRRVFEQDVSVVSSASINDDVSISINNSSTLLNAPRRAVTFS